MKRSRICHSFRSSYATLAQILTYCLLTVFPEPSLSQEHSRPIQVSGLRQSPEPERTERKNVKGQGHAASLIISLATHGRGCPSRGKGTTRSNSSHSRGLGGFAWASMFIEVPLACDGVTLARPFLSLCVSGTVVRRRACLASRVSMAFETHT